MPPMLNFEVFFVHVVNMALDHYEVNNTLHNAAQRAEAILSKISNNINKTYTALG